MLNATSRYSRSPIIAIYNVGFFLPPAAHVHLVITTNPYGVFVDFFFLRYRQTDAHCRKFSSVVHYELSRSLCSHVHSTSEVAFFRDNKR